MGKQVARDIHVGCVVEADCPAKHVELVPGVSADRICAMFDEQSDDRHVPALGGEVNWVGVVSFVPDVRIGAAIEQRAHHCFVFHAEMERRAQAGMAGERPALVDGGRMCVDDCGDGRRVTSGSGGEQLGQWCCSRPAAS